MEIFTKQPLRSYTETNKQTMDREIDEIVGIILDDYNKGRDIDDMNIAEQL